MKHVILLFIVGVSIWALLPPRGGSSEVISSSVATREQGGVKYVIRVDPGPLYLPGLVPENAKAPVQGFRVVADAFEKLYPDTRIEFLGCPEGTREWLVTQLSSAQAPDIIQVNARDAWQDVRKHWYIPLDGYLDEPNPFVAKGEPGSIRWWDQFKYPVHTQSTRAPDGRIYNVSLDMIETGIYYNKTIFARYHLSPPKDWVEFLGIMRMLKAAGIPSPMLVEKRDFTDWGCDIIFDQMYGNMRPLMDLNYDPRRGEDLNGYLDWDEVTLLHRHGFFTPRDDRWRETFRILREWREFMPQDMAGTDFFKGFVTQQGAMLWASSLTLPRLVNDPHLGFEWGMFYLPSIPSSYSRFADGHPMSAVGGAANQYHVTNSSLSDTPAEMPFEQRMEKSERLKRTIAFLQFMCMPKNCNTVVNEITAFIPNIKGVDSRPELAPFDEFLTRHYSMTKWFFTFDLQFDEVLERMFDLYMNDGISLDSFLDWMQDNIDSASATMTRQHHPDFAPLEKTWESHAGMRKNYTDLPAEAR
ncbi:MAG TPA: ABC transporter substrate-binding protein [Tepidisphaeraceae bacterium]|jgi:raffinose/stachyose/melibiose transport system substrate-binding protein|nr:ABC transporter substrate-binding protein [Tepidisphaeraceae bacterium]